MISVIILSLLPALFYSLVMYFTIPQKKIKLTTMLGYLFGGIVSVAILQKFWDIYPDWHNLTINVLAFFGNRDSFTYYHVYYFIQVAFIEEIVKLFVFLYIDTYRRTNLKSKDSPMATMLYVTMISLGFAIIENVMYGINHGIDVLYIRSYTSVVAHMVFGLFMGYFIAYGRMGVRLYQQTLFDKLIIGKKVIRNIFYIVIGFISAVIVHGIYDLHLVMNGEKGITVVYILLIGCVLIAYNRFRHLNRMYNLKQEELKNGNK